MHAANNNGLFLLDSLERRTLLSAALDVPGLSHVTDEGVVEQLPMVSMPTSGDVNRWIVVFKNPLVDPFSLFPNQDYAPPVYDRETQVENLDEPIEFVRKLGSNDFIVISTPASVSHENLLAALRQISDFSDVGLIGTDPAALYEHMMESEREHCNTAPLFSPFSTTSLLKDLSDQDLLVRLMDYDASVLAS